MGGLCSSSTAIEGPFEQYGLVPKGAKLPFAALQRRVPIPQWIPADLQQIKWNPQAISDYLGAAFADEEGVFLRRFAPNLEELLGGGMPGQYSQIRTLNLPNKRQARPQEEFELFEDILSAVPDGSKWQDSDPPELVAGRRHAYELPESIMHDPQFYVRGARDPSARHYSDIKQGELGDCWFLAAVAGVAVRGQEYLDEVCTRRDEERGVYEFRFFKDGQPVYVCVDDAVPIRTHVPSHKYHHVLAYCRSKDEDETWPIYIEKAYAKLHGGYADIAGGIPCFAFADLTGGNSKFHVLGTGQERGPNPAELARLLQQYEQSGYFLATSFRKRSNQVVGGSGEAAGSQGLIAGHAYTITQVVPAVEAGTTLIQLRNPWGRGEWKGPWSDDWHGWNQFPHLRDQLLIKENDGEFWMAIEDLAGEAHTLSACSPPAGGAGAYGNPGESAGWMYAQAAVDDGFYELSAAPGLYNMGYGYDEFAEPMSVGGFDTFGTPFGMAEGYIGPHPTLW